MGLNMQKLMKQAQKMQQDMARVQEELKNTEVRIRDMKWVPADM